MALVKKTKRPFRKKQASLFIAGSFILISSPVFAVDINTPITGTSGSAGANGVAASGFTGNVNSLIEGSVGTEGGVQAKGLVIITMEIGETLSLRLSQGEGAVAMVVGLRLLRHTVAQAARAAMAGLRLAIVFMAQAEVGVPAERVVRAEEVLSSLLAVGMEGMEGMEGMVAQA